MSADGPVPVTLAPMTLVPVILVPVILAPMTLVSLRLAPMPLVPVMGTQKFPPTPFPAVRELVPSSLRFSLIRKCPRGVESG